MSANFISGINYPKELLTNRVATEANVIACIYKDPLLLDDYPIEKEDLIVHDARFFLAVAKKLRKLNISVFDEVSILSNLSDNLKSIYESVGGYDSIVTMCNCVSLDNAEGYFDKLYKSNILLGMHNDGFDLFKELEYGGKTISYLKLYEKFTAQEVIDHQTLLLNRYKVGNDSCVLDETDVDFDGFVDECESGELIGVPFANCGSDKDGKTINTFKFISDNTKGLLRKGTNIVSGFGSVGKSSMIMEMTLSLINSGEKVLIISNEEGVSKLKLKIMAFLLYRYCKYPKCPIGKMMEGKLTDEDKAQIKIVNKLWKEKFKPNIKFIELAEPNVPIIKKKVRDYALKYGFSVVIYDVLKLEDCSATARTDLQIQEMTRVFNSLAKQYELICILTMQCATAYKNRLFLTNEVLSDAKNAKDLTENLIIIRDLYPDIELDEKSNCYCKPWRQERDENGVWKTVDFKAEPDANYKVIFLDKCRSGENASSSGKAFIVEFKGEYCTFIEKGFCKPAHKNIY